MTAARKDEGPQVWAIERQYLQCLCQGVASGKSERPRVATYGLCVSISHCFFLSLHAGWSVSLSLCSAILALGAYNYIYISIYNHIFIYIWYIYRMRNSWFTAWPWVRSFGLLVNTASKGSWNESEQSFCRSLSCNEKQQGSSTKYCKDLPSVCIIVV